MTDRHILIETIESIILQDLEILYRKYFELDTCKDGYSLEVDALVGKAMVNFISDMRPYTDDLVNKIQGTDDGKATQ